MRELLEVLGLAAIVEFWRRRTSLHHAVAQARARGRVRPRRSPLARTRLRRAIGAVDRRMPGGGNCVRRALLEMALDRGAAEERFMAGLNRGGGHQSGHAWLESQPATEGYDAVISI